MGSFSFMENEESKALRKGLPQLTALELLMEHSKESTWTAESQAMPMGLPAPWRNLSHAHSKAEDETLINYLDLAQKSLCIVLC